MEKFPSGLDHSDVEIEFRERVYDGFFKMEKVSLKHRLYGGGWSRAYERELFLRDNATCVLPYDPQRKQVVLLEQFRAGAILEQETPWLIELVAGINESGESPEQVARREAVEESGLELLALEPVCEYLASPGGSSEKVFLFCARVDSEEAGGHFGLPEENEDILASVVAVEQAFEWVRTGVINNAPAIIALQWLQLNQARLDAQWI